MNFTSKKTSARLKNFNDNMTFVGEVITGNVPNYIKLINKCLKESISVIQIRKIYRTCKQEPLEFQLTASYTKHPESQRQHRRAEVKWPG